MKRALTIKNIIDAKIPVFDFKGEWLDAFGTPQRTGAWYIYGGSGHGKTSFILMLIRQLSNFGKILYESYEEGETSLLLKKSADRLGLLSVNNRVSVCVDRLKDIKERLERRGSPDIVIIDSIDVSEIKRIEQVIKLMAENPGKLFIFTGWAEGKDPKKNIGKDTLFLANQKIFIDGYRAFNRGRSFGKTGYLDIWKEEAKRYHEFK